MPQTRTQDPWLPSLLLTLEKATRIRRKKPKRFFPLLFLLKKPIYQSKQKDDQENVLTAKLKPVNESWTWCLLDALSMLNGKTLSFNSTARGKAALQLLRETKAVLLRNFYLAPKPE